MPRTTILLEETAIWQRSAPGAFAASEDPLTTAAAQVLLARMGRAAERQRPAVSRVRFHKLGGPAMAKGYEDTEHNLTARRPALSQ